MIFNNKFFYNYLKEAPLPLALERTFECDILSKQEFKRPILDIGCGEGIFAYILFEEKIDVGIDPNELELKRAKQYKKYEHLINCYGDNIPKKDKSFNTIFSNSVIEHIEDLEPVLREAHRLLADEGNIYFTVPTDKFDKYNLVYLVLSGIGLKRLADRYSLLFNKFWQHYHYYNINGWINLFQKTGFKVEKYQEYCPKSVCIFNDYMASFSIIGFLKKKFFNKWYLSKGIRSIFSPVIYDLFKNKLKKVPKANEGGIVFFALKKI